MSRSKRTVVITGGTRGIGAAMVEAYSARGDDVIATGTKPEARASLPVRYHQLDFMDPTSVERFAEFLRELPAVDVLVNNAGINIIKPVDELTPEEFLQVQRVNTEGPFRLARAVAPRMKVRRSGYILNVASIWSVATKPGRTAYSTAKSALAGMTRALAAELGQHGIIVNTLSPGFTLTELTARSLGPEEMRRLAAQVPLGRMAEPTEIARVACFLTSPENSYLTGQNVIVDGGFTIV